MLTWMEERLWVLSSCLSWRAQGPVGVGRLLQGYIKDLEILRTPNIRVSTI